MVHPVSDVVKLSGQITELFANPNLLSRLRSQAIADTPTFTWKAAGRSLIAAYERIIRHHHDHHIASRKE